MPLTLSTDITPKSSHKLRPRTLAPPPPGFVIQSPDSRRSLRIPSVEHASASQSTATNSLIIISGSNDSSGSEFEDSDDSMIQQAKKIKPSVSKKITKSKTRKSRVAPIFNLKTSINQPSMTPSRKRRRLLLEVCHCWVISLRSVCV